MTNWEERPSLGGGIFAQSNGILGQILAAKVPIFSVEQDVFLWSAGGPRRGWELDLERAKALCEDAMGIREEILISDGVNAKLSQTGITIYLGYEVMGPLVASWLAKGKL